MRSKSRSSRNKNITPFWQRLPAFFGFPFQVGNLARLGLFTLGWLAVGWLPGLFSLILAIGLVLGFFRYCFNVLAYTAYGHLDSGRYPIKPFTSPNTLYKLVLVLFLQGLVLGFLSTALGKGFSLVASVVISLLTPATIMVLTITQRAFAALNPVLLASVVARIGTPYLLLNAFLFMLQVGTATALTLAAPLLPRALLPPVLALVIMAFSLIMFQMMGYVLYQNHKALGLASEAEEESEEDRAEAELAALDERIKEFMDQDNIGAALDWMRDALRDRPEDLARHERYHRLLVLSRSPRLPKHAEDYLGMLLARKETNAFLQIMQVMENCWRQDAAWQAPAYLSLPLAKLCLSRGRTPEALRLLKDFHKRFPASHDIAEAWLLQARILIERFNRDDKAVPFLNAILKQYPQHPAAAEARQLLAVARQMSSAG